MKRLFLAILLLSTPFLTFGKEPIVVGTFNVHYVTDNQDRLSWERRKESVAAAIREGAPDLIAFQEMETFDGGHYSDRNVQVAFLRERFPKYEFAAFGDPAAYPSTQPIMYRRDRFQPLERGYFFFSPNPDEIYADPWVGRYPAFCSWVRFRDEEREETFYLYNIHFDYGSRRNRINSAKLVRRRIEDRHNPEEKVILVGDFNAPWFFRPVNMFRDIGLEIANTTGSTVHFNRGVNLVPAIDHVLFSRDYQEAGTRVLRRKFEGVWPSDHYPVFVTID